MRRADRLFEIIQVLRRARGPLTARAIADTLESSQRTIYRDLTALMARRVPIRGEAGVGYVLDKGYDLPPLMLTASQIEAVVLGSQWVAANADPALAAAATELLAKVAAIVPASLRDLIDDPVVGTPAPSRRLEQPVDMARLRQWVRAGQKLHLGYVDEAGAASERTVWPLLVGYVAGTRVIVAWCELRAGFRYFRTDRVSHVRFLDEPYPLPRAALRRRWEAARAAETEGKSR